MWGSEDVAGVGVGVCGREESVAMGKVWQG